MKLIRLSLLFWVILSFERQGLGQAPARCVPGQFLICFEPNAGYKDFSRRFNTAFPRTPVLSLAPIAESLNIWLLETDVFDRNESDILDWLRHDGTIRFAQYNHLLEQRDAPDMLLPNDPGFAQQWQHFNTGSNGGTPNADLDSELAWDITTGGLSPLGDTIVVAVIDGGIEAQHEDLRGNLWYNFAEIPSDGVDNDDNKYIDDYRGWNVKTQKDNIEGTYTGHGTPIAGIVAAKGNNNIGVTGINWKTKLMFVSGYGQEAYILAAYDYVLKARKRYNATQGKQGAFVVAVNCSWGISLGQPSEAPAWCAAFDSLGAHGILSVASTDNKPNNVDLVGDLPTGCPSDFLISVTSLTKTDVKAPSAAWGPVSVDLGAYGKEIFSIASGNSYGTFSGTSFASPQVTGALGLLYAAPCSNLAEMARADPATAALWAKNHLLNSVVPNASLQDLTATGGRLNLYTLLQEYEGQCQDCLAPFGVAVTEPAGLMEATVSWLTVSGVELVTIRWRPVGEDDWTLMPEVQSPCLLHNLQPCTDYEFFIKSNCKAPTESQWSGPYFFRTDGCCTAPSNLNASSIGTTMATMVWDPLTAGTGYVFRIRPAGGGSWEEYKTASNSCHPTDLALCTEYECSVKALCGNDSTDFSDPFHFMTGGCGVCTELTYCTAGASSADDEWIAGVEIGGWNNFSSAGTGYEDFTGQSAMLKISPNSSWPIKLTPGFSGAPFFEYFRVYIDYNADGDFEEPDELAFDPGYAANAPVVGTLYTPSFEYAGLARMRILMKYKNTSGSAPKDCEEFDYGQVEDYCVSLDTLLLTDQTARLESQLFVYPQPAIAEVFLQLPAKLRGETVLTLQGASGHCFAQRRIDIHRSPLRLDLSGLPAGTYVVRLEHTEGVFWQKILKIRMP